MIKWQDGKQGNEELIAFPSTKNPKNIRVCRVGRDASGKTTFEGVYLLCGKVSKAGKPFYSVGSINDDKE